MARRAVNVFSLSFLDAMTCGFGAVILFFMIINANMDERTRVALELNQDQIERYQLRLSSAEITLEEEQENVIQLLQEVAASSAFRDQMIAELQDAVIELEALIAENQELQDSVSSIEEEIESLQNENEALSANSIDADRVGDRIREVRGDGNRQYLTGLRMSGQNIVILIDASTSMLARNLIDIFRIRNMDRDSQVSAKKWIQAVDTVDWLTAQIDPGTNIQIIAFNESSWSLFEGGVDQWHQVNDGSQLNDAVNRLRETIPTGGTSLHSAFSSVRNLNPKPDNIFLLVDGLPTIGEIEPQRPGVSGRERLEYFSRAVRQLPRNIPMNVILYPMEGDPQAAPAYWLLSLNTGGSMMAPSEDWP
jgi:uncharacterized protein YlxW (UPF0749 family)